MAGSLNKATLIGHVGGDPEIRDVQGGSRVANFSIATTESWKDKQSGERKERTEWHRVVCWNDGLVNVIEDYVKKGSKLYIEGELQTRKWWKKGDDETPENARYSTEVVMTGFGGKMILLGDPGGGSRRDDADNSSRPGNGGGEKRQSYGDVKGRDADGANATGRTQRQIADDDEIPF